MSSRTLVILSALTLTIVAGTGVVLVCGDETAETPVDLLMKPTGIAPLSEPPSRYETVAIFDLIGPSGVSCGDYAMSSPSGTKLSREICSFKTEAAAGRELAAQSQRSEPVLARTTCGIAWDARTQRRVVRDGRVFTISWRDQRQTYSIRSESLDDALSLEWQHCPPLAEP